ncbi:hypothetical protein [Lysobacter sp. A3-1-A15]|uniref:hypothetical protein n=1 Tax=Novilysobacter viscosus TaxID=3098602 RepID=UPI002EDA6137
MILFAALCFVGVAIAGFTAFVIFWPLTLVHIRDRHPALAAELGEGAFARPEVIAWLLRKDYRAARDHNLNGLATPAWLSLVTLIGALASSALLWLLAMVLP